MNLVWLLVLGLGGAVEAYALSTKAKGDTLSERVKDWFKVSTPGGKLGFLVVWVGFAGWFLGHILGWWS